MRAPARSVRGATLSAIRATAAGDSLEGLQLLAGLRIFDHVADVDDGVVTGVGAFVSVVAGCCVEGIAGWRYSVLVHSLSPFLVGRASGVFAHPRGLFVRFFGRLDLSYLITG